MFRPKYVIINKMTGYQGRTFYTKWGAARWLRKDMVLLGISMGPRHAMMDLHEIIY